MTMMNKKIYRQYDSRWATKAYPTKSSTFGGNGCGACAVLHCIIEQVKYANYTPAKIISYMKQFAVSGQGTTWSGIPTALKHYGMANVKELNTMPELWTEMKKGNRVCIILFSSGKAPNGTVWTTGGHYVAGVKYKEENGLHYLYMKDSGQRNHDKWYSYEKSMKGLCFKVWIATIPKAQRATTKKVEPKTTNKIAEVALKLAHPYGTSQKKWAYKTGAPTPEFREASKKYGAGVSKITLSDCGNFVNVVVRKSGVDKAFKSIAGVKDKFPTSKKFKVVHEGKKVPSGFLEVGDIIRYKTNHDSQHVLIYVGNGKCAEGGRGTRFPVIRKTTKYNGKSVDKKSIEVLRAKQ